MPLPMLAALYLQIKDQSRAAKSTTEEEFVDNLWMIVDVFHKKTGHWPILSYDNNKIQKAVNIRHLKYAKGQEGKEVFSLDPALYKVDLPTYSPDMNRAIEHVFGQVKPIVRAKIYNGTRNFANATVLQQEVLQAFRELKPGAVAKDVSGLPQLWKILFTREGATFEYPAGHKCIGTAGGYALKGYC